jgi:hypothetical protein
VSIAQQLAAKALTPKDVSRIIEQTRIQSGAERHAAGKGHAEVPTKDRERLAQTEHGRDR